MQTPELTVPAPDDSSHINVETNPSLVREWVNQLPYANLQGVATALSEALIRLNRHPVKIPARDELMACFRTPCIRLFRTAPGTAGGPSVEILRTLLTEMGYGHKHIINDCLRQKSWLSNQKKLLNAVYFALRYQAMLLLLVYEDYDCGKSNTWRDMLTLYRLAEQQNIGLDQVADPDQPTPAAATIDHQFKRTLLLRMLDPCHMPTGEARACFEYLNQLAGAAQLKPLEKQMEISGRFILDLTGQQAVQPLESTDPPEDSDDILRLVNVLPVSKTVHQELRQMELNKAVPPPGLQQYQPAEATAVLKRILQTWHARRERESQRHPSYGGLRVCCGLSAVHEAIKQQLADPATADPQADEEVTLVANPMALPGSQVTYEMIPSRQINRSQSGIALRLRLPCKCRPDVGHLVYIDDNPAEGKAQWEVGTIRRCLRIDRETLEIGVQFLRGVVQPLNVRPLVAAGGAADPLPALYVNRGAPQLDSILVSRGLFQKNRQFVVEEAIPARLVEAEHLLEASIGFDRFKFCAK